MLVAYSDLRVLGLLGVGVEGNKLALGVHVPNYYMLGALVRFLASTLRPKYSLFRYTDP